MPLSIVTGGSSGLGAEIVRQLGSMGHDVVNWDRDVGVDVTDRASIAMAVLDLPLQQVDHLINCAGINALAFLPALPEESFDNVMAVNAKSIFLTAKALLPIMRGGTILNIVSDASHKPMTTSLAYNASKGAAAIMTKQMARELGATHDVTVFSISPIRMAGTRMTEYVRAVTPDLRGWSQEQTDGKMPSEEDIPTFRVADFICFLLSSKDRHRHFAGCDIPYGA
jgi:3-oxoacyl-[acyl-carrier protein] reductase